MTEDSRAAAAIAKEVKAEALPEALKNEGSSAEPTESASKETVAKDPKGEAKTPGVRTDAADESVPTLRQIFGLPEKETDPADDRWKAFQETLGKEVKGIKWTAAMPDLAPKVCELLPTKISDVMLKAWEKVDALQRVLAESKKTPEKVMYLELAKHSIAHETRPFIDVKIRSTSVKKLTLTVLLGLELKGFVLKVQNGAIKEIQTGKCEAKGTIKYGKLSIAEKKLEPIELPFSIRIPDEVAFLMRPPGGDESSKEKAKPSPAVPAPTEPLERIEL